MARNMHIVYYTLNQVLTGDTAALTTQFGD